MDPRILLQIRWLMETTFQARIQALPIWISVDRSFSGYILQVSPKEQLEITLVQMCLTDLEALMVTKTLSCKISTSLLLTMAKRTIQTTEVTLM